MMLQAEECEIVLPRVGSVVIEMRDLPDLLPQITVEVEAQGATPAALVEDPEFRLDW